MKKLSTLMKQEFENAGKSPPDNARNMVTAVENMENTIDKLQKDITQIKEVLGI